MTKICRPTLIEVYQNLAESWARRGTCCRAQVGAVLIRDGHSIASGYNGSCSREDHCIDVGCDIQERGGRPSCVRTLHAEQALISYCAKSGIKTDGSDLWITMSPCRDCANLLINAGIKRVFYRDKYSGLNGLDVLNRLGIETFQWNKLPDQLTEDLI